MIRRSILVLAFAAGLVSVTKAQSLPGDAYDRAIWCDVMAELASGGTSREVRAIDAIVAYINREIASGRVTLEKVRQDNADAFDFAMLAGTEEDDAADWSDCVAHYAPN